MGSIEIEENTPPKSSYASIQNDSIEYFENLSARVEKSDFSAALSPLSDDSIRFLAGVYLHCSITRGICPIVLDPIFESDVINSVIAGEPSCPNMTKFWKYWAANAMDERHSYLVKTGDLMTAQNFRIKMRPRYIRCRETISGIMKNIGGKPGLPARYSSGDIGRNIALMPKLLNEIKQSGVNVFASTGMQRAEEPVKKN